MKPALLLYGIRESSDVGCSWSGVGWPSLFLAEMWAGPWLGGSQPSPGLGGVGVDSPGEKLRSSSPGSAEVLVGLSSQDTSKPGTRGSEDSQAWLYY